MSDIERRMDMASEVAALKMEVHSIHRENQIRHDNFQREKSVQDALIQELYDDVKELLALANKGRGGFWAGMTIASMLSAIVSWVATHFLKG